VLGDERDAVRKKLKSLILWARSHFQQLFSAYCNRRPGRFNVLHMSPFKRNSERHGARLYASLIVNLNRQVQRLPCLILDISRRGYRVRGSFRLKRGEQVEVIPRDDPIAAAKCNVVWVGRTGSALQGEAGLETIT
jgi:PilZ domain-containing protein